MDKLKVLMADYSTAADSWRSLGKDRCPSTGIWGSKHETRWSTSTRQAAWTRGHTERSGNHISQSQEPSAWVWSREARGTSQRIKERCRRRIRHPSKSLSSHAIDVLVTATPMHDETDSMYNTNESLSRKVQLLEEELETNDANLRETTEK